jgi:hypothetical protein
MVTAAFDVPVSVNFIRIQDLEGGSDKNAENLCQHDDHSSLYFYLETVSPPFYQHRIKKIRTGRGIDVCGWRRAAGLLSVRWSPPPSMSSFRSTLIESWISKVGGDKNAENLCLPLSRLRGGGENRRDRCPARGFYGER